MKYPYRTDYNDHFETPLEAYEHIVPLLDALHPNRNEHIIYDPYYCNGQTKVLLSNLGFSKVKHDKRDFYQDIMMNNVPFHVTLVTNPPYSDDHKEKCMKFAVKNLRKSDIRESKSFFVLMPNYIALRNHFRTAIADGDEKDPLDILYIVPPVMYEYNHPDGTGKDFPPFASIWFCGIHRDLVDNVKDAYRSHFGSHSVGALGSRDVPHLVSTVEELKILGAVPSEKRKNLKQRLKQKKKVLGKNETLKECNTIEIIETTRKNKDIHFATNVPVSTDDSRIIISKKKSRYRDSDGVRKKKRF